MNKTIPHELNSLPEPIEKQLADLNLRHARHQQMLEDHREAKFQRRDKHRKHWHRMKIPAITLI